MSDFKYKAFISYSHADEKWAKWLHKNLESFRIPKHIVADHGLESNRIVPIFRDRDELPSSNDLSGAIREALTDSENLIVICSPNAKTSKWVNEEVTLFKTLGRAKFVHCLLVGEPTESFPPAALVDVDGDGLVTAAETEPLAADARTSSDGKRNAFIKIAAGVLSVGFDHLRQRELLRRQRRLAGITISSIALTVLTSGLAVLALNAQRRAEAQEAIAVAAQKRTEIEASKAIAVSEFLQDVLRSPDPYGRIGREATVLEALEEALKRLERSFLNQPEIKAAVAGTIGKTYGHLGEMTAARSLLEESLSLQRMLHPEGHLNLAIALSDRAWIERQSGDLSAALSLSQEAHEMMNALSNDNNGSPDSSIKVMHELAWARNDNGEFDAAERLFRQALTMSEAFHEPPSVDTANAMYLVALVLNNKGDYDEAIPMYRASLAQYNSLAEPEPLRAASVASTLALALIHSREFDEAEVLIRNALAIRREHLGDEHYAVASSLSELGTILQSSGKHAEACQIQEDALGVLHALFPDGHTMVARSLHSVSSCKRQLGDFSSAIDYESRALEMNIQLLGPDHILVGVVQAALAGLYREANQLEVAEKNAAEAARIHIDTLPGDHWRVAQIKSVWGEILGKLERYDEAETLLLEARAILLEDENESNRRAMTDKRLVALYESWNKPTLAALYRSE